MDLGFITTSDIFFKENPFREKKIVQEKMAMFVITLTKTFKPESLF